MDAQNADEEIEKDILKLQLHSIPLNLNWDQNEEEIEESDDEEDFPMSQGAFEQAPTIEADTDDIPSTSQAEITQTLGGSNDNEEGSDDEELIDLSTNFAPTPVNLLKLNFAYQEVIEQQIAAVDRLLQENRFKMSIINENMEHAKKIAGSVPKLEAGVWNKLFFKDDNGLGPTNSDLERLQAEVGPNFSANIQLSHKWKKATNQKLREGVERCAQRNLMEPLYTKLEHLQEKLGADSGSSEHVAMIEKKISDVKQQLVEAKNIPPSELIKSRDQEFDWESISNLELDSEQTAFNCELHWKNKLHPSLNHSSWSADEDKKLVMLLGKHKNHDWRMITEELGTNRSIIDVVRRYQLKINTSFKSRPWTPEEDALLMRLVEKFRVGNVIPYTQIALHMKNRYAAQVVFRWSKTLDPSYKHTKFTPKEDAALLRAVRIHGEKWARIRDLGLVPGRNDAQLRERYKNALLNRKSSWSREDDEVLMRVIEEIGEGNWAAIAKRIPGRADCQCMRRWMSIRRNKVKGKKMAYRGDTLKTSKIMKIRKKLRSAIDNEGVWVKEESSDDDLPAKKAPVAPKARNKSKMSSKELLEVYSSVSSQGAISYVHKRPPKSEDELKCEEEIYKLMATRYRPLKIRSEMEGNTVNQSLTRVTENSKSITAKDIFIHFIKALNVNAEEALESIKRKTKSAIKTKESHVAETHDHETARESDTSPNRGRRATLRAIGGNEAVSGQSAKKPVKLFARNLYLPLCAPNAVTVRTYRDLTKDRERRVTKAKTILQLSGSDQEDDDRKHKPEDLLAHLRASYKYKIFRSRFNALMTWPTLLASLVPYKRRTDDGMLFPAVKTPRVAKTDDDDPPPAKKSKFV